MPADSEANPIRVLHVLGDSRFGGIAHIVAGLARVARSQGWEVDVLATDPTVQEFVRSAGMGVVDLDAIRRPIRAWDLLGLVRLWRFFLRERYDIVHTHTSKGGFVGRLAATLARLPVVIHTAHGFAFHEHSPHHVTAFYSALERLASRWCDRVITVSEFHRRWAVELGICRADRIVAIPNGAATVRPACAAAAAKLRLELSIRRDELLIFCNTRLAEDKGIEYLIEAAAILLRSGLRFRVVIAGDGPLCDSLQRLASDRGVADVVTFVHFRQDIADWLNACDLAVFPSLREGLSISLLEAMSAGKPIIATSIGSVRDLTAHTESMELVPPADPFVLAAAVHRLGGDRLRQVALGQAALELFQRAHTEERMLNSYRDLYLQMLGPDALRARPATSCVVRPANSRDLPQIVSIHQSAFSEFFLTRLGSRFLRRYYELVLAYRSGIILAREKDGVLQGFVCGFMNPPEFYRMMWRQKRSFMLPALVALLRRPSLTGKMLSGIHRLQTSASQAQPVTCELSSIAVAPALSGNGAGKSLLRAFLAQSWSMRAECVSLTTDAENNDAANGLYRDIGFSVVRRFLQCKGRWMNEYLIQRPQTDPGQEVSK
jgi:glycosyltransferase involved in cell wall biosynthesis/ribosomal protein S18 acetylase RimI-like enzyme